MTKVLATTQATFCATLVDEWWRSGVRDAVVCPGSRSTPMALALVRHGHLRVWVRLDERGAGYFAVGLSKASGLPVIVLTTSGTAAAELHPSVVEAHLGRVPLLVCTADRPPELQDVGAPQTIDQARLYGSAVRYFVDAGVPDEATAASWRSLASRVAAEATSGPHGAGPVHVNLPFREPLIGPVGDGPPGRAHGAPFHRVTMSASADLGPVLDGPNLDGPVLDVPALDGPLLDDALKNLLRPSRRGVVVAGAGAGIQAAALADKLGWPVIADPRSGARAAAPGVIGAADQLLRDAGFAAEVQPEVVVRAGEPAASKVLAAWLSATARAGATHVAFDPDWAWRDPGREVAHVIRSSLGAHVVRQVAGAATGAPTTPWLHAWIEAESAAQAAIDSAVNATEAVTEPAAARHLYAAVEPDSAILASSSMPVRDLEWFSRPRLHPPHVFANRGANGIDGVMSTLFGLASGWHTRHRTAAVYGLVGDLAVLHDASALVRPSPTATKSENGSRSNPAVPVVIDNNGGGIFSFLPQAAELTEAEFELLFGTPQDPPVADLIGGCGYEVRQPSTRKELKLALAEATREAIDKGRPSFVVVKTDRAVNVAVHRDIEDAVRDALARRPSSR